MYHGLASKLLSFVLLCFCIQLTVANPRGFPLKRRDDSTTPSITSTGASPTTSPSAASSQSGHTISENSAEVSLTEIASSQTTTSSAAQTSTSSPDSVPAVTSNLIGAVPTSTIPNGSTFNSTATPDQLPLTPELTPGFGVAGVILMLSGVVYTVVGIKNKMLHVFLSAGYLASLSVTVLILYVMNLPVSDAVQGAYVVAAVITGLIIGGGAIVFSEMTEGLGCLLGGFCFSMWLLVLKPGGLLTTTSGKAIFVAVFTFAGFATSFSHLTRPYGLITLISFGGSTAVVIGIDCLSQAGLKEFWAYLWDLNSNLFPIGATTYPLTRGIKVEIAAIVVIFLAGIVSQVKLWKVIKERRAQRAAERLEDERTMQQEEENVGRRIEDTNAEERNQWEAVYGDKEKFQKSTNPSQRDSGVGDMDSQKKEAMSVVTSTRRSGDEDIEMSEMISPISSTGAGLVMPTKGEVSGPITVRVATDPEPEPELDGNGNPLETAHKRRSHASARSSVQLSAEEEKVWVVGADGEARLERRPSRRQSSKRLSNRPISARTSGVPEVVPLPFKVPEDETADDTSSVATFADDDQAGQSDQKRPSKRLSSGSAMFQRLSKRSENNLSRLSTRISVEGASTEELVVPREAEEGDDRASSIAATMDGLSDGDDDEVSIRSASNLGPDTTASQLPTIDASPAERSSDSPTIVPEPVLAEIGEAEDSSQPTNYDEAMSRKSSASVMDLRPDPKTASTSETPEESQAPKSKPAPSVASTTKSKAASITKENLPSQLSKVVMSYRTNEWAKHLSNADAPEIESPKLQECRDEDKATEKSVPVDVEELQKTSENAIATPLRSLSKSPKQNTSPLKRPDSSQSMANVAQSRPESVHSLSGQDHAMKRSLSQQSIHTQNSQPSLINRFRTPSNSAMIPQSIVESPIEDDRSMVNVTTAKLNPFQSNPFGSSSTLISRRDTMLRNKSSFTPQTLPSTPEVLTLYNSTMPSSRAGSDAGSLYNYQGNFSSPALIEDDSMSLSARRNLIRQSSLSQTAPATPLQQQPILFDSHQPRRQSSAASPLVREQQLASWRASVQQGLQSIAVPKISVERQRSALWQERQAEEQRKAIDARRNWERDQAFDERMRRGDMLDAHREALSRMQRSAY